jgi:uncharacterized protein YaeQ
MALTATVYRLQINLSDVERAVYTRLDLRLARHPSETMRYLLTRTLAYCLCYEDGIAFSKAGLAATEEPPVAIRDATGALQAFIDVGAPSAERLHKATKAASRVALFTHVDHAQLLREARTRPIHKVEQIEVWHLPTAFLDELEQHVDRNTELEVLHSEGHLYVTVDGKTIEGAITHRSLAEAS